MGLESVADFAVGIVNGIGIDADDLTVSTKKIELNSQHSLRTNIRIILEETYDIEAEENRITAGFIAAF